MIKIKKLSKSQEEEKKNKKIFYQKKVLKIIKINLDLHLTKKKILIRIQSQINLNQS